MMGSALSGQLASVAGIAAAIASGATASGPVLFASSANSAAAPGVAFAASPTAGMGYDANQGLPALMYAGAACLYWSTSFISINIDPFILKNGIRIGNAATGIVTFNDGVNGAGFQTTAPATATSTGTKGSFAFDSGFIYICTATNTWKRVAVTTF